METKSEKFRRLSAARLEKAVFALHQLTHLASKNYEYSTEEVQDLITQLQSKVDEIVEVFGLSVPRPEPEPEPEPEPMIRLLEDGPIPADVLLQSIGPQIGAAIEALIDEDLQRAKDFLLNLSRS